MGDSQGEQAMLGKEGVGPATVIETTSTSATMVAPTQNATQSHEATNPEAETWFDDCVGSIETIPSESD